MEGDSDDEGTDSDYDDDHRPSRAPRSYETADGKHITKRQIILPFVYSATLMVTEYTKGEIRKIRREWRRVLCVIFLVYCKLASN